MIFVRLNCPAQYRVRRIDQRGSLSDRDRLSRRTHGQCDIDRQLLVHVEGDILLHIALKAARRPPRRVYLPTGR